MDFDGNFNKLTELDIAPMRSRLIALPDTCWLANTSRQQRFEVHGKTQSILLIYDSDFRYHQPSENKTYDEFRDTVRPIITFLENRFGQTGYILRLLFTRLPAKSEIPRHRDKGASLAYVHRLHLPIQTNNEVHFTVGNETNHMRAGELWEINNCRQHSVINRGHESRIHLILDWVTPALAQKYLEHTAQRTKLAHNLNL